MNNKERRKENGVDKEKTNSTRYNTVDYSNTYRLYEQLYVGYTATPCHIYQIVFFRPMYDARTTTLALSLPVVTQISGVT